MPTVNSGQLVQARLASACDAGLPVSGGQRCSQRAPGSENADPPQEEDVIANHEAAGSVHLYDVQLEP